MKHKKILAALLLALSLTALFSVNVFAKTTYATPAEIVAELTGRPVEEVVNEHVNDKKSYGAMAAEAGKLDEFHEAALQVKSDRLAAQVSRGFLTQEEADAIIASIKETQAGCDGNCTIGSGRARTGVSARRGAVASETPAPDDGDGNTAPGNGNPGGGRFGGGRRGGGNGNGGGQGGGWGGQGLRDGSCLV